MRRLLVLVLLAFFACDERPVHPLDPPEDGGADASDAGEAG